MGPHMCAIEKIQGKILGGGKRRNYFRFSPGPWHVINTLLGRHLHFHLIQWNAFWWPINKKWNIFIEGCCFWLEKFKCQGARIRVFSAGRNGVIRYVGDCFVLGATYTLPLWRKIRLMSRSRWPSFTSDYWAQAGEIFFHFNHKSTYKALPTLEISPSFYNYPIELKFTGLLAHHFGYL